MSEPAYVATQRYVKAFRELGGPQKVAAIAAIGRLLADLEEQGEPGPLVDVTEREPDVFALAIPGGAVIYELGAQHTRDAPAVVLENIERAG